MAHLSLSTMWRCDFCKARSFATYEEACSHEALCEHKKKQDTNNGLQPRRLNEKKKDIGAASKSRSKGNGMKPTAPHPFFTKCKHLKSGYHAPTETSGKKSDGKHQSDNAVFQPQKPLDKKRDVCSTSKSSSSNATQPRKSKCIAEENCKQIRRSNRQKRTVVHLANESRGDDFEDDCGIALPKHKVGKDKSRKSAKKAKNEITGNAFSFIVGSTAAKNKESERRSTDAMLNEQATAIFRAQRLQKQRELQERQKSKTRQQIAIDSKVEEKSIDSKVEEKSFKKPKVSPKSKAAPQSSSRAPRFPVPSHLVAFQGDQEDQVAMPSCVSQVKSLPIQTREDSKIMSSDECLLQFNSCTHLKAEAAQAFKLHLESLGDGAYEDAIDPGLCRHRLIQEVLSSLVSDCESSFPIPDLYSEKYKTDEIMQLGLEHGSLLVSDFLVKWMVQRRKVNDRRDEKQRLRAGIENPGPKQKGRRQYDDDCWSDSDDEDRINHLIPSLCLLTGPCGCGKSQLIHSVARSQGCSVFELNTSHKRGTTALKKFLLETTQSHSSIELFKDNNAKLSSIFSGKKGKDEEGRNLLGDTDDEEPETDDDDSATRMEDDDKRSSVTVILIDEVDNLFEGNGDSGFWPALWEVAQKSKCPIFLTANKVPKEVDTRRLTHIEMARPSPTNCVRPIRALFRYFGLKVKDDIFTKKVEQLKLLAELCSCDLRRLSHEVFSTLVGARKLPPPEVRTLPKIKAKPLAGKSQFSDPVLQITDVVPKSVNYEELALLTISGNGFDKFFPSNKHKLEDGYAPVTVCVGDQICPVACIINSNTIIAVKAPCRPPCLQDLYASNRLIYGQRKIPHTAKYKEISIRSRIKKTGLTSVVPCGSILTEELLDGSKVLALPSPFLLNCENTASSRQNDESDDEMEFETAGLVVDKLTGNQTAFSTLTSEEKAQAMLQEGIKAWERDNTQSSPWFHTSQKDEHASGSCEIETAINAKLSNSDAALLADIASRGFPFLSGAAAGFGFNFTEEYPALTNEKSKPPNEDHLFSSAWKDDCYFYGDSDYFLQNPPAASRERQLVKESEMYLRGFSPQETEEVEVAVDGMVNWSPAEVCEENSLIPNRIPPSLLALPFHLRTDEKGILADYEFDFLLEERRRHRMDDQLNFLSQQILSLEFMQPRIFARRVGRVLDCCLSFSETVDPDLFVDYLPILRVISVHERAAHVCQEKFLVEIGSQSRRTRRSSKKGRQHYFESLSPPVWGLAEEGSSSAQEAGKQLASMCLIIHT